MLQAHTLGLQGNQDSSLGTHQAATLISHTTPVTKSLPPGTFHTAGILPTPNSDILDKPECLDSINSMPLCLHSSTNLDHSIFSSNLVIPPALLPNEWIIDSGATDHMVHSISYLPNFLSQFNFPISCPLFSHILMFTLLPLLLLIVVLSHVITLLFQILFCGIIEWVTLLHLGCT